MVGLPNRARQRVAASATAAAVSRPAGSPMTLALGVEEAAPRPAAQSARRSTLGPARPGRGGATGQRCAGAWYARQRAAKTAWAGEACSEAKIGSRCLPR